MPITEKHREIAIKKLFLGINNRVVCIDKSSGQELWKTKLKGSGLTNVYYEDDNVFAYAGGHLFCLKASDGSVQWENPLKGLGYGACIIASERQHDAVVSSHIATQQAVAASTIASTSASSSSNS